MRRKLNKMKTNTGIENNDEETKEVEEKGEKKNQRERKREGRISK
jgi:hypothetical protein